MKLSDLKLSDYGARSLEPDNAHIAIVLATNKTLPLPGFPTPTVADDNAASRAATRAINAVLSLSWNLATVDKDPFLNPAGQQNKLQEPRKTAVQLVAMAADLLKGEHTRLTEVERQLYGVPPPKDVSETLVDIEIRGCLRGQETQNLTPILQRIADGDLDGGVQRMLTAILRSPVAVIPGTFERVIQDAWRNAIANTKASEVAALNAALQNFAWCETAVTTCAQFVKAMSGYDQLTLYERVRTLGGTEAFGYSPAMCAQLDRVLAARAETSNAA